MNKIVILGSTAAAVSVIEQIRAYDKQCAVTLISFDGNLPYRRDLFAPLLAKEIALDKVYMKSKDFFERHNVEVVLDKKISRINIKRKIIFTEDKEQFDYEVLIIIDTPENRFPAVKGSTKTRIYGFKKLKDIEQLVKELPIVNAVAVHSDSFTGLQAAAAIAGRKKEVLVIASEHNFISDHFEEDVAQWLIRRFDEIGVRIIRGNPLTEILGDGDAKAVRLKSGKVFATDIIIFAETDEDLRLFSGSELQMANRIYVDQSFRSNIKSIFALDGTGFCNDFALAGDSGDEPALLEAQAKTAVGAIYGQEVSFHVPAVSRTLKWEGFDLTVIGQTVKGEGCEVQRTFNQETGQYKALYVRDNRLVGAILINQDSQKQGLMEKIERGEPIDADGETQERELMADEAHSPENTSSEGISTELVDN